VTPAGTGHAVPAPDQLARDNPEWSPWLALVGAAIERADDPTWGDVRVERAAAPAAGAPLLAGAVITVHSRALDRWVADLLEIAARNGADVRSLARAGRGGAAWDPIAFVEAAVNDDRGRLDELAAAGSVRSDLLSSLAMPAAMPVLRAAALAAGPPPDAWPHGYCPVCAAWPALAEARGLEGRRQLRCGRCGGDWSFDWLRCPFCGNGDHTKLGGLVSETAGDMRKVETCQPCRGYVKTVTTLVARSASEVVLEDVASAAFDVAAIEAGFLRPAAPGQPLDARVAARRRGGLFGFRR
jgi:FdhE protein